MPPSPGGGAPSRLTQLLPPPPAPYLPQSLLTACFRRWPRPAPLMEAPVCGVSRPSFRRLVKEMGTALTRSKKNVPSPILHWAISEECLGLVTFDGQVSGLAHPHTQRKHELCCLSSPWQTPRQSCPDLDSGPFGPASPQPHLVCKIQGFTAAHCPEPSRSPQHPWDQTMAPRPGLWKRYAGGCPPTCPRASEAVWSLCQDPPQAHLTWGRPPRGASHRLNPGPHQDPQALLAPSTKDTCGEQTCPSDHGAQPFGTCVGCGSSRPWLLPFLGLEVSSSPPAPRPGRHPDRALGLRRQRAWPNAEWPCAGLRSRVPHQPPPQGSRPPPL